MILISNRLWLALIIILVVIGGFIYLGTRTPSIQNQPDMLSGDQEGIGGSGVGPDTNESQVKTFEVEGRPFEFSVKEMRVKQGDIVRVTFSSIEGLHDFTIDEFNARTKQLQAGESDTVEFVADKTGTYEYYCSVGNHRQMGMRGNLIVE